MGGTFHCRGIRDFRIAVLSRYQPVAEVESYRLLTRAASVAYGAATLR
jgi:hypothetical protein